MGTRGTHTRVFLYVCVCVCVCVVVAGVGVGVGVGRCGTLHAKPLDCGRNAVLQDTDREAQQHRQEPTE